MKNTKEPKDTELEEILRANNLAEEKRKNEEILTHPAR